MISRDHLLRLIDDRLAELGMSAADASTRAVGNHYLIRNIRRRKNGLPSVEHLMALCDVLGLEFHIGPHRTAPPPIAGAAPASPLPEFEAHVRSMVCLTLQYGGDPFPPYTRDGLTGDYGFIPAYADDASQETSYAALRADYVRAHGLHPKDLRWLRIADDSMEPVIQAGDAVVVDLSQRQPRDGLVFALRRADDSPVIKRLELCPQERWWGKSDNTTYEPRIIDDPGALIGRAVWWAHIEP